MAVFDDVVEKLNGYAMLDAAMNEYTTFKIGGKADVLIEPRNEKELCRSIEVCREYGVDYYIIGNGSNLLVSDKGIRGAVIRIADNFADMSVNGTTVTATSGVLLSSLANCTLKNGLMGLEWAAGIPGTIGGALAMNAGAYGGEISQVIKAVRVLHDGVTEDIEVKKGDFAYRYSKFAFPEYIVLGGTFELMPDDGEANARKQHYNEQRKSKQPLSYPSAGSTFKRPVGHFAGALIEQAGLKGYTVGGAQVSEKHAGFVINIGNATAADVTNLIADVQRKVFDTFGVELEPEIKIIGEK